MKALLVPLLLALVAVPLQADGGASGLALHGWLDGDYAWNGRHPQSGLNFFSGAGTSANRADRPSLNVAALDLAREARPVGFHLTLVAGDSAEVVHAGEPHPRRLPTRLVYQASVSFLAPVGRGLAFEAGIYPSHIGFESLFTKDDWNYTRGWLAELSPYYQSGIKAAYAWSGRWSAQVHLLRGWQLVTDDNSAPSYGTQVAYAGARLNASFNSWAGPELPSDDRHLRLLADLVATWKVTPGLSLGGAFDRGRQAYAGDLSANWTGLAVYARWEPAQRQAIALRAERFGDSAGGISGTAQTLTEGTVTWELRPAPHLILKFEGRRDHSTAPLFDGSRDQTLAVAGAVVAF